MSDYDNVTDRLSNPDYISFPLADIGLDFWTHKVTQSVAEQSYAA